MTGPKLGFTAEDCLTAFKTLHATHGVVTRDRYRKESGIPETVWEFHFGTFAELKRQAGLDKSKAEKKLVAAVARATAAKPLETLNRERASYGESYVREDKSRYKTLVVASDMHDKEIDPFYLRVLLDTCKRVQPDAISLGGDIFDLPEFGKYTVDPREWDAVGRIKYVHDNILAPMRASCPDTQMDLIEGNHECVTMDTEILTDKGWVAARDLERSDNVASFDLVSHDIRYDRPLAMAEQDNREVYAVESLYKCEHITDNHNLVYDGILTPLKDIKNLEGQRLRNAIGANALGDHLEMPKNIVQLATWIVTHGVVRRTEREDKYWLSFKVPKRIERRIKAVVQNIPGLYWIKTPKGVEVEGEELAHILELITGLDDVPDFTRWDKLPDWFDRLDNTYGVIVAHELTWASTQGFMSKHTSYYNGYRHALGEALQWFLVTRGVPCSMRYFGRDQYILTFNEGELERWRGRKVTKRLIGHRKVLSVQTINGTLITRMDGKINFTGNCRLIKNLADFSPATRAILGDLHGMTLGDLFGLSKYQVNYIAKADLKSYTERDHRKELQNNYKVYWDSVMVHHFPHARHMGMPGVNGHHHKHVVWSEYNVHCGEYEWHQLGAGHKRKASYCEGERWHNGFAIIHVDTLTKTVNIEYVPITTFAVVGGKFYSREPHELIT